jgi:hypothetical protein
MQDLVVKYTKNAVVIQYRNSYLGILTDRLTVLGDPVFCQSIEESSEGFARLARCVYQ